MVTEHPVSAEVSMQGKDCVPARQEDEDCTWSLETLEIQQQRLQGGREGGREREIVC